MLLLTTLVPIAVTLSVEPRAQSAGQSTCCRSDRLPGEKRSLSVALRWAFGLRSAQHEAARPRRTVVEHVLMSTEGAGQGERDSWAPKKKYVL